MRYHRCVRVLGLLAVLSGCDGVFNIREVPPPADASIDAPMCRYLSVASAEPGQDEDDDMLINSVDPCPTVPFAGDHDEDGDGIPDDCDPCPMLQASGDDAECDLVGAACDPDDTVSHEQTIHGFGDSIDLGIDDLLLQDDQIRGPFAATFGRVLVIPPVSPIARYEIAGRIRAIDSVYRSISIDLVDQASGEGLECQLEMDSGYSTISISRADVDLATLALGPPMTDPVEYRLVAAYDGTQLTMSVTGNLIGMISAPVSLGSVRYGAGLYHNGSAAVVEVDYLRRVATK